MNGTWKKGPGTELFAALEKVSPAFLWCTRPCNASAKHIGALHQPRTSWLCCSTVCAQMQGPECPLGRSCCKSPCVPTCLSDLGFSSTHALCRNWGMCPS